MTGSQTTILVVDDDPIILDTVADFLRLNNYDVLTAPNGNEGLRLMAQRAPHLVLSDISMPDVDGYEFFERIRRNPDWGTIPFIFMSARGQPYDLRLAYAMGADAYLTKPFELEDLQIAVQSRLQRVADIEAAARSDLESMKQQLMTVFGHEIRTPLTFIYGYLNLIREDRDQLSDAEMDHMLAGMERGTKRLMHLVEDMMLLMRLQSGAAEYEIKRYRTHAELGMMVRDAVGTVSAKAADHHIHLDVQVPDGITVYCLPNYLQDAITRLLDNAIKFAKMDGGTITIHAQSDDQAAYLSVIDEGIGIDAAKQSQIFDQFSQVDRQIMEQQGLGLGLAIAGGIVRLHNGSIHVDSVPNEGSTFTIMLPVG